MQAIKECPICGSHKVRRERGPVTLHPRGRSVEVPDVEFDRCLNRGETFFDDEASRKIDAAVPSGRRRKSA
jgi:YgiT-type zinc finger domain-containing protein